ncbi:hypothetical protein [Capillimicrobium parvum]|uniref:Uncharacterized protein n=1 Tax=Capillimicrobium parvum TaxID=2884022 RepID=A0A9E7C0Y8_9ACTN|nr:hypothetical protein [Capillimicrobium parvum]UGS36104.1 hypothetical protein DSM104329_02502 [Capillimicrobium parvum]
MREPLHIAGATSGTATTSELAAAARLIPVEGTGTDPLGRYAKGQRYRIPLEHLPDLLDRGWVEPADVITPTLIQIASMKIENPLARLANPVHRVVFDSLTEAEAYALVQGL